MIRITDQYFWNLVFTFFFLIKLTLGVIILDSVGALSVASLTTIDMILLVLASQRLTRLFVYDHVTKWFREQFYDAKVTKAGKVTLHKPTTGPRRTAVDLLSCPWCFGIWASATISFFYLLTPYAYFLVLILAVSSAASLLQLFANGLGHRAEQLKKQNEQGF